MKRSDYQNKIPGPAPDSGGLASPRRDHSNCGVGVLMDLSGRKTHRLISESLEILRNLDHRGARGAEENTGDGAGILFQKPHAFFKAVLPGLGDFDSYGVGQIFFPRDDRARDLIAKVVEHAAENEAFDVLSWRDVPTDNSSLGKTALDSEPFVRQVFLRSRGRLTPEELDTRLYVLMRVVEKSVEASEIPGKESFYICSLDRRKIVYKGLLTNGQVETYYPDLRDERVASSLALVHSRFSTNTLGSWELAHPYRNIVHNGEINTLRGNVNWMRAREADIAHPRFGAEIEKLKPITSARQSDTAVLDNVLELIVESGRTLSHALRMVIPEAWNKDPLLDRKKRDWYDYHSTLVEPWDGPALVAFTDGFSVGAVLDRNGFRPCRYILTRDRRLVMASETGVLDIDPADVVEKGRLKPGQMFFADAVRGTVLSDEEVFATLADQEFGEWLRDNRVKLDDLVMESDSASPIEAEIPDLVARQAAFGYTVEQLGHFLEPMGADGKDPVGAMGDDSPPPVLSNRNKPLFNYFKQLFAQVSNPPIDYIREDLVTTLESHIGHQRNFLDERPEHCRQVFLSSPILTNRQLETLRKIDRNGIRAGILDITYPKGTGLKEAIDAMRNRATAMLREGFEILILSDRETGPERIPIPSLLAVSGLHHHLIREGARTRTALVLESGHPCLVHHFCTLIGYGADAVNPYLAFASIRDYRGFDAGEAEDADQRYIAAIEDGILKVMSKMGISTLESYKGTQIFEALGLNREFVNEYFTGTVTRIEGCGIEEIEKDLLECHNRGFGPRIDGNLLLDQGGDIYWRRDGEFHWWNPDSIGLLQHAARTGNVRSYEMYARLCNRNEEHLQTLRGLLEFVTDENLRIPVDEVESRESIFKRFFTGSMSFGALSLEAHETCAIAMNRIGGTACSGEGGEQTYRFGTEKECANKQVASGRFGVTANYLAHARQIEIKIAQGAKPGEGGQLPGEKVDEMIAEVRHTTPGVGLISPPPHHDIYSIEDLAQLIHDLKCANPGAEIHVKLVSSAGVGTIAAGVAKARADSILIGGDSGGTGAAAKTSIKHAGLAWELGLAESQQVLLENRLRSRVRLRTDGGMRTGRDVAIAALLGAEEYGFGTSALVALGCIMLRKCHCNTCSVGVATQDPELRRKFPGKPEHLVNYMTFIADDLRMIMAELGFRTLDEMVGRTDRLRQREVRHPRAARVDLSKLLYRPESEDDRRKTRDQNHNLDHKIDHELIERARAAIERGRPVRIDMGITNQDRTFGAMLSSLIAKRYGQDGLPEDTIRVHLNGSAGQSFGAFLSRGLSFHLTGEANDYVGKGLSGGKISITTPPNASYEADANIILGNVALYGAVAGEVYFNGIAGERFAVRNSGVIAVVEGVGNHACEYMTGGVVAVLGGIGKNFGAGMSGGEAFIYCEDQRLEWYVNPEMVLLEEIRDERDRSLLKRMIENHLAYTQSRKAKRILGEWDQSVQRFVKVMPKAYAQVILKNREKGRDIRIQAPAPAGASLEHSAR